MKSIIAGVMALTLVCSMMGGCGKVGEPSDEIESSVSEQSTVSDSDEVEDNSDEDSTSSEEQKETEGSEADKQQAYDGEGYEAAIREFFDASNSGDYKKMMSLMFPERMLDSIDIFAQMMGGASLIDTIGKDLPPTNYEITEIVMEGTIDNEALQNLLSTYDVVLDMAELIESYGGDLESMTDEQKEELEGELAALMEGTLDKEREHYFTVTEGYDVTVRYLNDGEPDEDYFYVYYIEGDGWKLDNSLRRYVKKSQQVAANANAKTLYIAYNSSLSDMEYDDGADLTGTFIVSSDDTKNVNVPDTVDIGRLKSLVEDYTGDVSDYNYFVIIHNGKCIYTAVFKKDGTGDVGTYPVSAVPIALDDFGPDAGSSKGIDYTFEELYEMAKGIVK